MMINTALRKSLMNKKSSKTNGNTCERYGGDGVALTSVAVISVSLWTEFSQGLQELNQISYRSTQC